MRQGRVLFLAVMTIGGGVRYAYSAEQFRRPEHLHQLFQEVNRESFGGQLPDPEIRRERTSRDDSAGQTYQRLDGRFVVVIDPATYTTDEAARDLLRHMRRAMWRTRVRKSRTERIFRHACPGSKSP